jgi:FKBP-type peptidyl-prolyl cis-trans isomerase
MENKNNMNMVLAVVICLALAGLLIFISIRNKTNMTTENSVTENTANTSAEVAKVGDTVSMNYTGRLENGTVFDSNVDPKFKHVEPFVFNLGAGQVIAGWDKGIVGMKVGEKKTLTIAPADGYGANGVPGVIPPNATLIFDVELLAIKK